MSVARVSSPSAAASVDAELDLRVVMHAIWRHRLVVLVPTVLAFVLAFAGVNLITPRYQSEARVLIENRESALTRQGGDRSGATEIVPIDEQAIASQVQIVQSRDLARAVVRDLSLARMPEFDPMVDGRSPVSVILAFAGIVRDISQMTAEERALEAYYERLSVVPVERSRVIEIRFQSREPELAARIANAIAERYIEFQATARLERDRRARQHFERQIESLRRGVTEAENRVAEHRARFDLLVGAQNQTLGVQTVTELNTQLSAAQGQRAEAHARASAIRDMLRSGRSVEASEVANSPIIQRLSEQRAQLRAEIAQQATVLLPGHPRMRELQASLADVETQFRLQAERIARGLENDARVAGSRHDQLQRIVEEQKRRTASQGDNEVQLRNLEREAKAQRDLLESWLAMSREASARDSLDVRASDARIVSTAAASSTPAYPKKLPIILVATLSTFLVMLMGLITRELASGRAFVLREVAHAPGSRTAWERVDPATLEAVPAPPAPSAREVYAERVVALVARLADRGDGAKARRVLVTGALEGSGATTLAVSLARAAAAKGARVILVDAHLKRPGLNLALGLGPLPGVTDALLEQAKLGAAIHRDPVSRAHVMPIGKSGAMLTEIVFEGPRFHTLIAALEAAYDHVIVDMPPVVESDATTAFASLADMALIATRGEGTDDVTVASLEALQEAGAKGVATLVAPELPDAADGEPGPVAKAA